MNWKQSIRGELNLKKKTEDILRKILSWQFFLKRIKGIEKYQRYSTKLENSKLNSSKNLKYLEKYFIINIS